MEKQITNEIHEDLKIGNEQVTSNECWMIVEDFESSENQIFDDLVIGNEQICSNECYEEEEN